MDTPQCVCVCMCVCVYSLFDWSDTSPADQLESLGPRRHVCNGLVKCRHSLGGGDIRTPLSCQERGYECPSPLGGEGVWLLGMSRQLGDINIYQMQQLDLLLMQHNTTCLTWVDMLHSCYVEAVYCTSYRHSNKTFDQIVHDV